MINDVHLMVIDHLVQMRLMQLRLYGGPPRQALQRPCGVKSCGCTNVADTIACHSDAFMHAPRTPEGRASRKAIVEGIAVGAWSQELGVDLWGLHWCRNAGCSCRHPLESPNKKEVV